MVVDQLKDILTALNDRVTNLEHDVNDTLIGGLKKASDEYKDAEDYKTFSGKYGNSISEVEPFLKCINGDDYDSVKGFFNAIKTVDGYGKEGFDSDALMAAKIEELKEKMKRLGGTKAEEKESPDTQSEIIAVEAGDDKDKEKEGEKEPDKDSDDKPENTIKDEDEPEEIPSDSQLAEELKKALLNN
jgi:hypothetical protein